MINEKKIAGMVKLQSFEDREGKREFPIVSYFRSDFISMQLLKGFVFFTLAAVVTGVLWGIYNMEELLDNLNTMDYIEFIKDILVRYLAGLLLYLCVIYIYATIVYAKARKKVRRYHRRLKEVSKQ